MELIYIISLSAAVAFIVIVETLLYVYRRKRLQNASAMLRQAKEEVQDLSRLSLNTPYPTIQVDRDGHIIFANPAALENFNKIRDIGFAHPVLDGLEHCFKKTTTFARDINIGTSVYHQTVIPVGRGQAQRLIIYCYDITARKTFENKLIEMNKTLETSRKDAEHAMNARGEFLANMSHELRTPMNGIIGLSDMLLGMEENAEKLELMGSINSSARSLLILLNDILDFSKIEAGELHVENIPCDIRQLIEQVDILHKTVASQKALVLDSHIAPDFPHFVMGDGARIQQILNNLISNAIKFTEEGKVEICVDGDVNDKGEFVARFKVQDTGIGIPKDKQALIFEKFQQADNSTARKYGGTGLGLAITRSLIELMGGQLSLESEEGNGTSFTFALTMPIADIKMLEAATQGSQRENAVKHYDTQCQLLVVDDHPVNLLYARMALKRAGFANVDEAENGTKAIEMAKAKAYDLILMDCQMPDIDGFEATQIIREMPVPKGRSHPVIIAVTADAMHGAKEKCLAAGMNDYVTKPVGFDRLQALFSKWLPCAAGVEQKLTQKDKKSVPFGEIVNCERLHDFTEGDADIEEQIISIFLTSLREDLKKLHQYFKDNQRSEWQNMVHKIYGAASNMGVEKLSDLCQHALEQHNISPEDVNKAHIQICNEYKNICSAISFRKAG